MSPTEPSENKDKVENTTVKEPAGSKKGKEDDERKTKLKNLMLQQQEMLLKIAKPSLLDRIFTPIALAGMLLSVYSIAFTNQNYVDRSSIKSQISKLIENDADLDTIKHVFNNKEIIRKKEISKVLNKHSDGYQDNVSLSTVLADIKADLYLSGKIDSDKITKVNDVIQINNMQNPFDGLPTNQKDLFVNIVTKSNSNYPVIQTDVNKIANELMSKNVVIDNNDTRTKASYYITIISFITAISIAAFQIFQSRPKKIKEIIITALNEVETKTNKST